MATQPSTRFYRWKNIREDEEPKSFRLRHRSAWLASLILHVVLLVVGGLLVQRMPQGADVEPGRTAGIVLARASNNQVEYFSEASDAGEQSDSAASAASATAAIAQRSHSFPKSPACCPRCQPVRRSPHPTPGVCRMPPRCSRAAEASARSVAKRLRCLEYRVPVPSLFTCLIVRPVWKATGVGRCSKPNAS